MVNVRCRHKSSVIVGAALLALAGCSSIDTKKFSLDTEKITGKLGFGEPKVEESPYEKPAKMAVTWSDTVFTTPGKPPTRGFGGRIYFYNERGTCIPVEGQLVVYAYDDTSADNISRGPSRKFAFTPEQFTDLFSESDLGASYSVWLPWDPVGGEQLTLSLLPVFRSSSGQVVMGQQSINILPGRKVRHEPLSGDRFFQQRPGPPRPDPNGNRPFPDQVRPVEYQQPIHEHRYAPRNAWGRGPDDADARQEARGIRTSTINLTPSLARRLSGNHFLGNADSRLDVSGPAAGAMATSRGPQEFPMTTTEPPSARFVRPRPRVREAQAEPPVAPHVPSVPFPGGQPSTPPYAPRVY